MSKEFLEYRKKFHELPIMEDVTEFPIHLDIELTNRCNLNCEMCPFHGDDKVDDREPEDMSFELYKQIIDEGSEKGLKAVKLNYGGEPLLYGKLIDAIHYAKKKGILDVQINTNAMLLNNRLAIMLIQSGLDLLIITDYNKGQQVVNATVLKVIRDAWGRSNPIIRVKTNNELKWYDVPDEFSPNVYFDYCNLKEEFEKSDFKCTQPWQRMLILSNGVICSCSCGLVDFDKQIDNVRNTPIEAAWKNKKMRFLRHCHSNKETHLIKECRLCPARKNLNMNKTCNNNQDAKRLFTEHVLKRI